MIRRIFIVLALLLFAGTVIATPVTITRTLPSTVYKGLTLDVSLSVVLGADAPNGVIIKEYAPAGWTIKSTNPTATVNSSIGEIKWVLFGGDLRDRTLTYTLQVPNETGIAEFHGEFLYTKDDNQITLNISGGNSISILNPELTITVNRLLPEPIMRGNTFTATLKVGVDAKGMQAPSGLIIKEYIPLGWNLTTSTPTANSFNFATGEIRWVITNPTGITNMTVYYTLRVPDTEVINSSKTFNGTFLYTFEDLDITKNITGNSVVTVKTVPGDDDGDNKIGDFELLDYITEYVQGKASDWDLLATINVWAKNPSD